MRAPFLHSAQRLLTLAACALLCLAAGAQHLKPRKPAPAHATPAHVQRSKPAAKPAGAGRGTRTSARRLPLPRGRATARTASHLSHANARTLLAARHAAATRSSRYATRTQPLPRSQTFSPARPPARPAYQAAIAAEELRSAPASSVAEPAISPAEHSYAGAAGPVTSAGSPFLYASNLAPFFQALAAHQQGAADARDTIRILQFGDSHTAADLFTGAVRAALQAHFGDGGLGFQYPGHPFPGYHLAGSTRSQTSGWFTEGNHFTALGDGDLGLGGISIATFRPNETVSVGTTCTTFQLHYLRQSGGGRLRFSDNGSPVATIDTGNLEAAPADQNSLLPAPGTGSDLAAGTFTYACTAGQHAFTLTTLDSAPVKLFGIVTEQPGVTYECLGLNGAVAPLMLRWNQRLFAEYLRLRDPTLIVLAYGTNEAAQSASSNDTYVSQFTRLIDSLHRYVPSAAILVLGPYDRATRVGRGRHSSLATWPGTARIIADQQAACRTHGCTYYNEQTRMGGPGSMIRWASAGLAQPDHTHLTGTGYRELAGALYADLLAAYTTYEERAGNVTAPPPNSHN